MSDNTIRIFQINIQSLEKHKEELSRVLIKEDYDVALISECWSKVELEQSKYKIPGFFTFLKSRNDGYGGAGIAIKKKIKSREVQLPDFPKIQAVGRHIVAEDILVVSLYVAPNISVSDFEHEVKEILLKTVGFRKVIVGGDFNAHHFSWDPLHSDGKGTILFDLLNDENFVIMNNGQPTFFPVDISRRPSAIDLVIVSPSLLLDTSMNILDYGVGSHHMALETVVQLTSCRKPQYFTNRKKIFEGIKNIDCNRVTTMAELQNETKKILKHSKQRNIHSPKFWWSEEVEQAWEDKRAARSLFNRTGGIKELLDFKKKEAIFVRKKKESSKESFQKFVASFDPQTPSSIVWEQLRRLTGGKRKVENVLVHVDIDLANEFLNKHFPMEIYQDDTPACPANYDVLTVEFWQSQIAKKTQGKTRSSAPGSDGISYQMLGMLQPTVRDNVIRDLNTIWRTNRIPTDLKTIKIVAIPKPGKNPETVEGTRPISLVNCGLKILNAAALQRLEDVLEDRGILPDLSFGFRKRMSTLTCLEFVNNKIFQIKNQKRVAAIVFVDLSNAFNCVKVDKLEETLLELNIPPELTSWFVSFLVNRRIQLQAAGEILTRFVSQGLPQGDVCSPTLFNVYTADLHNIQVEGVTLVQYADDFAIIIEGDNRDEVAARGESFLRKFKNKAEELNLTINPQKTKTMLFINSPRELDIHIGDTKLENVKTYRYLGLTLDRSLRYGAHIKDLVRRLTERQNMIKVISGMKFGGHPQTLGMIYNALFKSCLDYGSTIFGSACKTNLGKIDVLNNQCLRKVTGCTKTTPINSLHAVAGQIPPEFRRIQNAGKQLAKHYHRNSVVKHQIEETMEQAMEQDKSRFTFIEQVALEHAKILRATTSSFTSKNLWEEVKIETELPGGPWRKKMTSDRALKQLTLSLIHGKYSGRRIIYTDASSNWESCGVGIFDGTSNFRLSLKLEHYVCIMSAELEAIWVALQYIRRSGISNAVIMTDSKAGLEFIKSNINERFRDEIVERLLSMAARTHTTLQWIPGHTGTAGNEIADQLAKSALEQDLICNNKVFSHDTKNYFLHLGDTNAQQWYLEYAAVDGKGRKFFQFQNTIPTKPWYTEVQLTNSETRTLNRLLTGHDYSAYWLCKMHIQSNCICDNCDEVENAEHILFSCAKFAQTRRKYELDNFKNIYQIFATKNTTLLRNVIAFLKEINKHI